MLDEPSRKSRDSDFDGGGPELFMMKAAVSVTCTCTCSCPRCSAGRPATGGAPTMSPLGVRPLGCEPIPRSGEALLRRHELILRTLLPQVRQLAASMAQASDKGTLGFGELELLASLQRWLLQLQIEEDQLRLILAPPDPGPKAP